MSDKELLLRISKSKKEIKQLTYKNMEYHQICDTLSYLRKIIDCFGRGYDKTNHRIYLLNRYLESIGYSELGINDDFDYVMYSGIFKKDIREFENNLVKEWEKKGRILWI